mmetsp:Transcript_38492/g.115478  ORF Transcript_38492/g.115478 Transcript_38492/m.115478 type:complete len:444 (+) Transcript_38492:535-1866(+)
MNAHFGERVPLIIAAGLVADQMRDAQQRPRTRSALNLRLDLVRQRNHPRLRHLLLLQFVQCLLVIAHRQHPPQREHRERLRRTYLLLDHLEGYGRARGGMTGVLRPPRRVPHEAVEEHGLILGVRDRRRGAFLGEEGTRLTDVGEVCRVARLVHQCGQGGQSGSDGGGVRQTRKVGPTGNPGAVGLDPGGNRPVTEAVGILAGTIEQVQGHGGIFVPDAHGGVGTNVSLDRFGEGKVRIHLLDHRTRHHISHIPRLQRGRSEPPFQFPPSLLHERPRPHLQPVQYFEQPSLPEPLGVRYRIIVIILESQLPRELVPELHYFDEPVRAHERTDRAQSFERGPARRFVRRRPHHIPQRHGRRRDEPPSSSRVRIVVVSQFHAVPFHFQRRFDAVRLLPDRFRFGRRHGIAFARPYYDVEGLYQIVVVVVVAMPPFSSFFSRISSR